MDEITLRVVRVEEDHFGGQVWGYHIYLGPPFRNGVANVCLELATPIQLFCKEKAVADKFPLGSNIVLSIK